MCFIKASQFPIRKAERSILVYKRLRVSVRPSDDKVLVKIESPVYPYEWLRVKTTPSEFHELLALHVESKVAKLDLSKSTVDFGWHVTLSTGNIAVQADIAAAKLAAKRELKLPFRFYIPEDARFLINPYTHEAVAEQIVGDLALANVVTDIGTVPSLRMLIAQAYSQMKAVEKDEDDVVSEVARLINSLLRVYDRENEFLSAVARANRFTRVDLNDVYEYVDFSIVNGRHYFELLRELTTATGDSFWIMLNEVLRAELKLRELPYFSKRVLNSSSI